MRKCVGRLRYPGAAQSVSRKWEVDEMINRKVVVENRIRSFFSMLNSREERICIVDRDVHSIVPHQGVMSGRPSGHVALC
jgi:hypothetical protein